MQGTRLAEHEPRLGSIRRMPGSTAGREPASVFWENSPDCQFIVRVEAQDTFVYEGVNPAVERQTGLLNAVVVGHRVEEVIDPRDTRRLLCEFADMAAPLRTPGESRFTMRP